MTPKELDRITLDPTIMAGRATIRDTRVTVSNILAMLADGISEDSILAEYHYLEREDIRQALAYAAWRTREIEVPLKSA